MLNDAKFNENQKSLNGVIEILELDIELPFYIIQSIIKKEFKETAMAEQLAELESVKRAKRVILKKEYERKQIAETYLAAFPHMKSIWRYANFHFVYRSFYDSSLIEKIQEAQCSLLRKGIIHPFMSYFMRKKF